MEAEQQFVLRNSRVLNPESGDSELFDVRGRDGRIVELASPGRVRTGLNLDLDLGGAWVLPGLIDCHVHVTAVSADLGAGRHLAPSYVTLVAARSMRGMLHRGFTTVRDVGGADIGLARAQREGLIAGPRLHYGGQALSQTGGHGDFRGPGDDSPANAGLRGSGLGHVVDGVSQMRRAVREELRKGAHHIKLMASGGVVSPTDRIDSTQFSNEELRAAVEEAEAANRYVSAHAYTARAVNRALRAGVRTIEHGNLIDDESVALFLNHNAFLVPTTVVHWRARLDGLENGLSIESWNKAGAVLDAAFQAIEAASRGGVNIAYGSDLSASTARWQNEEFRLRGQIESPLDVLQSATIVGAALLGRSGEIGVIAPGSLADLIVVDSDPLADLSVLADIDQHLLHVMQGGQLIPVRSL